MILVIGDEIEDVRIEHETTKRCPEGAWPIVTQLQTVCSEGGALAVYRMVASLGFSMQIIGNRMCNMPMSRKERIVVDGTTMFRRDYDVSVDFSKTIVNQLSRLEFDPSVILIADYGKGAISRLVIDACLDLCERVIVDPYPGRDSSLYHGVYGITPNRREQTAGNYWEQRDAYPKCCVKLDSDGMQCRDGDESERIDSTAILPIVDTCGAGDQVLATIGVMLAHGYKWIDACRIANNAAGVKCGKIGATPTLLHELPDDTFARF